MCKAMEDMRNEALERGRKEGHILTMIEKIKNMKKRGSSGIKLWP